MKRFTLAALLVMMVTAPAVHGQARLLAPVDAVKEDPAEAKQQPVVPGKGIPSTLGPPTSLPPEVPTPTPTPSTAPPHQLRGREPAHGTKTAGVPDVKDLKAPALPAMPAFPAPEVVGPPGRFWAELDALLWWLPGDKPPGLITTSPAGTPQNLAGVNGAAGTRVLAGGRAFNDDPQVGFRLNVGWWFDSLQTIGIQAGAFWLANNTTNAAFSSDGSTILARPFFNVNTGKQSAELIAFPGVSSGSAVLSAQSSFDGWDVAIRQNAGNCCNGRIDAIVGYRQLRLADQLAIGEDVTALGAGAARGLAPGSQLVAVDHFDTVNTFYGGEVGFVGEYRYRGWTFEGLAKMSVGCDISYVNINGASVVTAPGQPATAATGGLLAQPTNIGLYRNTTTTLIPELGFNAAYDVTDHLRVRGGYSFLYWDHVARPGEQVDTGINPNQVPGGPGGGAARPAFTSSSTDLVVQGVNVGVEVRY